MKLWHLTPQNDGADPWDEYDVMLSIVVRAETEERARELAAAEAGAEGHEVWMEPGMTFCRELTAEGAEGTIMGDFRSWPSG